MILVDTHVVIWLAEGGTQLSPAARAAIGGERGRGDSLAISGITLVELAVAYEKKRIILTVPLGTFLEETESRFTVLPLTSRVCAAMSALPASFPRDPADRLIAATAQVHGLRLVTADKSIRKSRAVPTVW